MGKQINKSFVDSQCEIDGETHKDLTPIIQNIFNTLAYKGKQSVGCGMSSYCL